MRSEKPWWFPGWPSLRDIVTSVIALGLLAYTGYVLAPLIMGSNDDGLRHAREAFAILGTGVGAVLGFYFGAGAGERIARQATQQATDAVEDKAHAQMLGAEQLHVSGERVLALEREVEAQRRAARLIREQLRELRALLDGDDDRDDNFGDEAIEPDLAASASSSTEAP